MNPDAPPQPLAARPMASTAPRAITAAGSRIALWWCPLERAPDEIAELAPLLSPAESARAARFGSDLLRHRWVAGRATLRRLLGAALGMAPGEVALVRGRRGRPELAGAARRVDFNVSHTGGVALIAIAHEPPEGMRIGVDVERADREVGAERLARKFLTPREQRTLDGLASDDRRRRFLRYWTCKEAMSKATGDGLVAPFRRLDVELGEVPQLVEGPPPYEPARWSLEYAAVPDGWLATVAVWQAH